MAKRLPIDPLYSVQAQHLTRRERKHFMRHTMQPFTRARRYQVDEIDYERQSKRELMLLDIALGVGYLIIVLCLIAVVLR